MAAALTAVHVAWAVTGLGGETVTRLALRVTLAAAAVLTASACRGAASRSGTGRIERGWALFTLAARCWAGSQAIAAVGELATGRRLSVPSVADLPRLVAMVVAVMAVLAFVGKEDAPAARLRGVVDGLLIAASALFVSWALVLERLYGSGGEGPARALSVAYALGDVLVVSLLLATAERADREVRRTWWLLGAGVGLFALSHSMLAYAELARMDSLPWTQSTTWLAACLVIGLAAVTSGPAGVKGGTEPGAGGKVAIVVPYVALGLAAALALGHHLELRAPAFLAANGVVLVVLLLARQFLAQLENVELNHRLEERVRRRTAELHRAERHFRSIAQNASEVLTVVDASGVIRYQSASVTRVLGYSPDDLLGRRLDDLLELESGVPAMHVVGSVAPPPAPPAMLRGSLRRADDSACQAEITVSNLLDDDAVRGLVLTSRDIGERVALEAQLRRQALHDPLTGLGNRALFRDRLEHAMARTQRHPELLAVVMIDLDGFKQVNDSLGHGAGDRLLVEVARRLQDCVRTGDTVARMGGDEFAVLIERADLEGPEVVAQRIVYRLRAPVDLDGRAIVTHGSVGVAMGSTVTSSAEELLRNADLAMYAAKSGGKGAYEIYEREMHAAALERVETESALRDALRRRELSLHFQPLVQLPGGRISGAEALVRWEHPERGMISPAEFVPVAEESGLIVDLGRWVLGEACRQGRRFQEAYPTEPPFTMAVNVSARQLTSPWLVEEVRKALAESRLPPSSLVLEITEGALMRDAASIVPTLEALRGLGLRLAIDDFGTGWSSLSRLRSFPVDKLKIDQSFVSEIGSSGDDAPIVAAIVSMAHNLNLTTVAEGVETPEQLACLHHHGCEEVQGYLLSRPLPAEGLLAFLADPGGMLEPAAAAERASAAVVNLPVPRRSGREAVAAVLQEVRRVTGADGVFVTEVTSEGVQEVHFTAGRDAFPEGTRLPWAGSPCREALERGVPLMRDVAQRFPDHALVRVAAAASLASVPLLGPADRVIGTLCATSRRRDGLPEASGVLLELFARLVVLHLPSAGDLPNSRAG